LSDRFQQKSRLDEKTTSQAEDLSGRESKKGRLDQIDQEKMSQHEEAEIGKNVAILKDSLILLEPKKRQHPKSKDAAEFKALSKELDELAIQEPARGRLLANSELTPLEVRAWLLYAETQPGLKNPERYVISRLLAADMPPAAFVEFAQLSDETLASFKRRAEQLMQGRPLEEKISSDLLDIFSQWLEAYHKLDETLVRNLLQAAKAASTTAEEVIEPIDQEADWAEQVWSLTLDQLQLKMTKSAFNSWLRQTHPLHYDQDHLVIAVQNDYAKDWLENRLADMIERVLAAITGRPLKVEFSVERQLKANTG
jgi:hypothetical protein